MDNLLQFMLDKQLEFQKESFGFDPSEADTKSVSELIHLHSQFAVEEVYEMLRELPFHKPWRDYSQMSATDIAEAFQKGKEEFMDVMIFLMNVGNLLGLTEEEIKTLYLEKRKINIERQENPELGYVNEG